MPTIFKITFILGLLLLCLGASEIKSQTFDYRSEEAKQLEDDLFELNNDGKYDESQARIQEFLDREDLSPIDQYYAHILRSYLHKRLFDYARVFVELDRALEAGLKSEYPDYVLVNVQHERALALFDVSKYQEAKQAMIEIQDIVADYLHEESLSMYYMQFAYFDYLDGNYDSADSIYTLAEMYMKRSGPCHLPIIYTKKMKLYAATGEFDKMEAAEEKAHFYADSCKISKYTMLIYEWGKEISEKRGDFEAYRNYDVLYDSMEKVYATQTHLLEILDMEEKYESELKDQQIEAISQMNRRLWIFSIVVGALLLAVLFLIRKMVLNNRILKKQKEGLAELDKLNKEIFAIISHDFKEPLMGFNFLLARMQMETPAQAAYYKDLQTQLRLTTQVLQNLIDWASSELAFRSGEPKPVDLQDRVGQLIGHLKPLWEPKGIVIKNEVPDDAIWKIDPFVLEIALRNIIVNAVKYSDRGQEIQIGFENNALSVLDQGPGIPPNLLSQLFSRKVQSTYGTQNESGSGIGLFISNSLLMKNGFQIKAANNSQMPGATFSIYPNNNFNS